jgi:hypothetical protein
MKRGRYGWWDMGYGLWIIGPERSGQRGAREQPESSQRGGINPQGDQMADGRLPAPPPIGTGPLFSISVISDPRRTSCLIEIS